MTALSSCRRVAARSLPDRLAILFEEAGDLSLAANRARDRHRRAAFTALMAVLAKVVSVGTALVTVPLTLHYLGTERYGMWMILSSLLAMLSFADLGIGNGLLNMVAAAHGRDDVAEIRRAVSSGIATLGVIAAAIVAGFALVSPHVAWPALFNVRSAEARAEAGPAVQAFVLCFALAIPAGVVQRVQLGLQDGMLANLWQCGGSLLALLAVLLAIQLRAGLPWLVIAFLSGPLLANLLNSLLFFGLLRPDLRPSRLATSRATSLQVMRTGLLFLLLQVVAAIAFNSDNVIIAQLLGASSVPLYAVPERLFSLITMTATMALAPLWPAYREAIVRGDVAWAGRTLRRSLQIAVGCAAALSIPLIVVGPWIIRLWVGDAIRPPIGLIVGLGLWKIVEASGIALAMFLNGAHIVRPQVICASAMALLSIGLEIVLVRAMGVSGAVWATLFAFVTCEIIPYAVIVPRILRALPTATAAADGAAL